MLVEREIQLIALREAAKRASSGQGGIIILEGEAGIGKTSLLMEFSSRAAKDCKFLWGGCEALFTPRPLGPLQDMAEALDSNVATLLGQTAAQGRIFPALLSALQSADETRVMIFEDVHWADNATLDLIKYLGRRVSMLHVLLVLSLRRDEVDVDHPLNQVLGDLPSAATNRQSLQPLSPDAVATLAESAGHGGERLHEITGGNPFFVTELLAGNSDDLWRIPASIRDAVWSRISRLTPAERELLEMISIVPGSIEFSLLQALFGASANASIEKCLSSGMLLRDEQGNLRFRHELARQATLERLNAARQKTFHQKVEAAMTANPAGFPLSRRVHHAAGADNGPRVLSLAPQAATEAARLGAHQQAAQHLATALKYVDQAPTGLVAQLYEDWAYEAGIALQIDDSIIAARQNAIKLWQQLGRFDKVGLNLRWLSRLHWYRGESQLANDYVNQAVEELEKQAPGAELAMAYSARSQMHMLNDRTDEAIAWGKRAINLAEQLGETETRVHALNNVGSALLFSGRSGGAQFMEESLRLALQHGFHEQAARAYTNYAEYGVVFKDFALAEKILAEGIAFDTRHDLDSWTHYLVGRKAQLCMEQGKLREAETIAAGVMKLDRLTLVMKLPALMVLGRARMRLGESDGLGLLQQALRDALATGEPQNITPTRFALVEAAWLSGERAMSHMHLNALAAMDLAGFDPWELGEMAVWWKRCKMGSEFATEPKTLAAPRAAELQGDLDNAAHQWLQLGLPYEAALVLMQTGKNESASRLRQAVIILDEMEAKLAASFARAVAKGCGTIEHMPRARRGPYSASRNHPLGLTPREVQVLELVVQGMANQDIAAKLVRSQRTVEHHVSSLLGKLNANSRIDIMLRLRSEPWLLKSQ